MSAEDNQGQEGLKPDWFSLVESDTRIQKNTRDRGFSVIALAGPLLLISAGLLFTQTNEGQNASATVDTSIAASATSGTSELANSTPSDVGVATDPVATNSVNPSGANTSVSTPVSGASQSTSSQSSNSLNTSGNTSVNTSNTGNTISSSPATQGFVPPAAGVSNTSSDDDDAFEGKSGHVDDGNDDDAYEHEGSEESDDD